MALYRLQRIGVLRTDTLQVVVPQSGDLWHAYREWCQAGNTPDPYEEPAPPAETLPQAKARRLGEVLAEGMALIKGRIEGIHTFGDLQLLRQIFLSIAPAARQPTTDMQWLIDMWQEGETVKAAIQSATTVAEVDAVTPSWPSSG